MRGGFHGKDPKVMASSKIVPHYARLNGTVFLRTFSPKTVQPLIAEPPNQKIAYQSPHFTNTDVDYIRPFMYPFVGKDCDFWPLLFTTGAFHVEVLPSTDSSCCEMAEEHIVSRWLKRTMIWSIMVRILSVPRKNFVNVVNNRI